MDLALITPYLASIMLHLVRVGAFFMALQFFGAQSESKMLRLVLAISLASMFWWIGGQPTLELSGGLFHLFGRSVVEAVIGFAAGFVISLLAGAMAVAGEMISHDMGFMMSRVMDPVTGRSSPVMSQFFQTIVVLLVFAMDLHHEFLRVLAVAFEVLPVGGGFNIEPVFERMTVLTSDAIELGMRFAIPVMGVLVVLTAMLVMLGRAIPNINLLEFSFGVRILLGIFATSYFISEGTPFLRLIAVHILSGARVLFLGA
ncbi:MAG: flagellar biosynthetic protein FliR [Planctomycetota bacterium]|jgi:flagellar biosynthetic protein FliR